MAEPNDLRPSHSERQRARNLPSTLPFILQAPLWREIMMEAEVLKTRLAAGLGMATLMLGAADAQTAAPSQPAGPGQVMTQMPANLMRASQLMGIDVYGDDNQKIGDIEYSVKLNASPLSATSTRFWSTDRARSTASLLAWAAF